MPKTVKIFLSSTFKDMDAERDVLIKNVFPRLREKAEGIDLFIREVDLRWGVTEEQAKRGEALEICLDGIEECRPYFLCMMGKRYGWIPAPGTIRVKDFERMVDLKIEDLKIGRLSGEDIDLLKTSYHKTEDEKRVYTLDNSLSNQIKDRLQAILEKAGLPEARESITEKEINHAVLKNDIPRSIPNLDELIKSPPGNMPLTDEERSIIETLYVRTSGERVWRLIAGPTDSEKEQLRATLNKMGYNNDVHSFFYFREDAGEDHPDYAETDPELIDKLNALKTSISASGKPITKQTYPCTWDPSLQSLNLRSSNLESDKSYESYKSSNRFEDMVFNDLWNHIQENPELRIEEGEEKSDLEKEQEFHQRFIDSRTYNFQGRKKVLGEIENAVNLALEGELTEGGGQMTEVGGQRSEDGGRITEEPLINSAKRTQVVMVVGEPGSGKSALLAKLVQNLTQPHPSIPQSAIPKSAIGIPCFRWRQQPLR